jgi:hypothetical protein
VGSGSGLVGMVYFSPVLVSLNTGVPGVQQERALTPATANPLFLRDWMLALSSCLQVFMLGR